MKLTRPAIAVALGASLVLAGHAGAATKPKPKKQKPVCFLVTDPAGDSNGINQGSPLPATSGGPTNDALDITSVDVASDKLNITGVLRIKKLSATSTNAPTGMNWSVNFTIDATAFTLAAHADPTGKISYDASYLTTTGGSVYGGNMVGVFDTAKSEIHITAPVALLAKEADAKPGSKFTAIGATTGPEILVPESTGLFGGGTFFSDTFNLADTTSGGKDYVGGTYSCVTPGK